jgi:ABC-type branched-subunit amino acid transport system substrate-binding protein
VGQTADEEVDETVQRVMRDGEPSPDFSATYAPRAAEILLDAIARSEGTRASVTRMLFRTEVDGGILGDIRFDENGDLVEGPVTIYRSSASVWSSIAW